MTIKNVLYFPQFEVNLILVSKLCIDKGCILVFETDKCVIQAKKDLRKNGPTKEIDELYYLEAAHKLSPYPGPSFWNENAQTLDDNYV